VRLFFFFFFSSPQRDAMPRPILRLALAVAVLCGACESATPQGSADACSAKHTSPCACLADTACGICTAVSGTKAEPLTQCILGSAAGPEQFGGNCSTIQSEDGVKGTWTHNVQNCKVRRRGYLFFFIIAFGFVLDFCDCVWVPTLHKQMLPQEFDHRFGPCH
jgi:hypothetical protein